MSAKPPQTGGRPAPATADERQRRSAEALRANLRRRKDQARHRAEDEDRAREGDEGSTQAPGAVPPTKAPDAS